MFYIVIRQNLKPRSDWPADLLKGHLDWANRENQTGALVFSGPGDQKAKGIYLIKADDLAQARAVADRDPIIREGYCTYQIYDWDIQRGIQRLS